MIATHLEVVELVKLVVCVVTWSSRCCDGQQ